LQDLLCSLGAFQCLVLVGVDMQNQDR